MSSCAQQKRAALVEWRGFPQSSPSRQGGSHGQHNHRPASPAVQTLPPSTPPPAQSPTALATATPPTGSPSAFGPPLLRASLRRGVHAPDLLPLFRPAAGRCFDHRQPYDPQSAPHAGRAAARTPCQLSSRLLETTVVAVAFGTPPGRVDHWSLAGLGFDSCGWRRYRRRASRQNGLRQGPPSRRRAFVPLLYRLSLRPQVGGAGDPGAIFVYDAALGAAGLGGVVSQSRQ